jgi:hypothetical protein
MIKLRNLLKEMQDFGGGMGTVYAPEEMPYKEDVIEILVDDGTEIESIVGNARIGKFPNTEILVIILENEQYSRFYPLYVKWRQDRGGFYTWEGHEVTPNDSTGKQLFDKLKKKVHMAGQDR